MTIIFFHFIYKMHLLTNSMIRFQILLFIISANNGSGRNRIINPTTETYTERKMSSGGQFCRTGTYSFNYLQKKSKYSFCFKIKRILILKCNIKKEKMQFNEELTISVKSSFQLFGIFLYFSGQKIFGEMHALSSRTPTLQNSGCQYSKRIV